MPRARFSQHRFVFETLGQLWILPQSSITCKGEFTRKQTQQCSFSFFTRMKQESLSIRAWLLYVQQNTMFTGEARAKWRRKVLRLHFNCKYFETYFLTTQQMKRSKSKRNKLSVTSGLVQQECSSCCGRTVPRVTSPVPIFFPFLCKQPGKALNLSKAIFSINATYR